ncbi:hypothetical protein L1049_000955 [Liquidambar formosana]|uniref:Uncharacterized protein n=1 Tax=Liquidambar formosana TaxID=63359 RepID=A0AAP0NBF6_LIQFO
MVWYQRWFLNGSPSSEISLGPLVSCDEELERAEDDNVVDTEKTPPDGGEKRAKRALLVAETVKVTLTLYTL